MNEENEQPSGTFGLLGFAANANVQNALQKLILFGCADCPDPSGRPGIIVSYEWLAKFCLTPVDEVKAEIDRMLDAKILLRGRNSVYRHSEARLLCNTGE